MPKRKSPKNSDQTFEALVKDPVVRRAVTRQSHQMFFSLYLRHYIKYPMAEFQKDIIRVTEDQSNSLACIVAFRGSAKSTLVTLSYAIWSVLGIQEKKFVLIVCQTQAQAKQHMTNLRSELESNPLLQSDLGPFNEEGATEWGMSSLVFSNTGARIMVASLDQSIRGLRHHEHRPDLIILDDIEDLNSTKTVEGRNKTFDWFTREIIPLGDIGTRIILVGNLLHEDSLMMRLKQKIEDKELDGIFLWYPLLDDQEKCLWPGKFDTKEKIEELRRKTANELAWLQEYLLRIISDATRVIWPEWIQYGDDAHENKADLVMTAIGVDLAISERTTADCTAMVVVRAYGRMKDLRIYVQPNPVNERLTFPETRDRLEKLVLLYGGKSKVHVFIEEVGYQAALIQEMKRLGYHVEGVKLDGCDKRSRLALASPLIKDGFVLFPQDGADLLLTQLLGFGRERHDDLVDACVHAIMKVKEHDRPVPRCVWVSTNNGRPLFSTLNLPDRW